MFGRRSVGPSPCAWGYVGADSSHDGGHICHHLLLKTNEMSLFPIFPPGPFIPIFAPSFRNLFRRKEEGKGSKRREERAGGEDEARRESGIWGDIGNQVFLGSTKEGLCRGEDMA